MPITQLSSANTFDHWLVATQNLIATMNTITDGPTVTSNSLINISGLNAQLNVRTSGSINTLYANTANIANILLSGSNISIPGNISTANITTELSVGGNGSITGNLTVGGNVSISHSMNVVSNITVGNITVSGIVNAVGSIIATGNASFGNVSVANTGNINILQYTSANGQNLTVNGVATINSAVGNLIYQIQETSFLYSLILG